MLFIFKMTFVSLLKAGTWALPKPFDGSVGCFLDTFLTEHPDCLEVTAFVFVASGASDTIDSASQDSMTRMALFIIETKLDGVQCCRIGVSIGR